MKPASACIPQAPSLLQAPFGSQVVLVPHTSWVGCFDRMGALLLGAAEAAVLFLILWLFQCSLFPGP